MYKMIVVYIVQTLFAVVSGTFMGLLLGFVGAALIFCLGLLFDLSMLVICSALGVDWKGDKIEW